MKKFLLSLFVAAASLTGIQAANPTIYGVYGYMNGYSKTTGVYKFNAETPNTSEALYTYTGMNPYECGSVILDDRIVYIEPFNTYSKPILKVTRFTDIDDSGTYTRDEWVENLPNTSANTALAVDPISKRIYGFFFNEDKTTFFLGTLDPETGLSTKIKDVNLGSRPISLAISNYGVVYGITQQGKLFKGNYDGDFEEVGTLTVRPSGSSTRCCAAAFDPDDDTFYWVIYDNNYDYCFCVIEPETCQVTKTVQGLGSASSLYIPAATPSDAAPVAISDLAVTADGFDTNITVSFTVPNQTVGGSSISAGLSAYVAIDGEIVENGSVVGPGNSFSGQYDVSDGSHTIVAWVSTRGNNPVASQKSAASFFAGQDKPEAVGNLTATKGAGNVVLSWTAPAVGAGGGNFDTATLRYKVSLLANDKGEEGEELGFVNDCSYTYILDNDDLRFLQFEVVPVTNSVTGLTATTDVVVVGEDFPGMVTNLTAVMNDATNSIDLAWEAPATGQNGSEFDAASLAYNVYVEGEDNPVASNLSSTSYSYVIEGNAMRALVFEVKAVTRKGEGNGVKSDKFVVGDAYEVPYSENFDDISSLDDIFYTVINVNDDAKYWALYSTSSSKTVRITYTSSNGVYQDDWLITAPIRFNKGYEYTLQFDALLSNPGWGTENLEVHIGNAATVEAMTADESNKIYEAEYSVSNNPNEVSFTVPASGVYYVGFHCVSPGNHGNLDLDNIVITGEASETPDTPSIPEDAYVVYNDGTVNPELHVYGWWNDYANFQAANPAGEGQVFEFKAADGGAAASMGLNMEAPQNTGSLHDATLNFYWYATTAATYTVRLTSLAQEDYSFTPTADQLNQWNLTSLNVAEKFPTVAQQWNDNANLGAGYVFSIIMDNGTAESALYLNSIYYSDVDQEWEAPVVVIPAPETVPTPEQEADDVFSFFSAYGDNVAYGIGGWGQSTQVETKSIDGKDVLFLRNFNYLGLDNFNINVSDYDYMHVDYWTPATEGVSFGFVPISLEPTVDTPIWVAPEIVANQWNSYDAPLSDFGADMSAIRQLKFVANLNGTEMTQYGYIANVYFWKEGEQPVEPAEGNVYVGTVNGIDEITETSSEYPYQLNYTITYNEDRTLTVQAAFNWEDGVPVGLAGNITAHIPNGNISIVLDEETGIGTSTETFNAGDVVEFTFWQARAYGRTEANVTYTVGRPFDIQQAADADESQLTAVDNAARTITLSKKSDIDALLYVAAPTGATVYYLAAPVSAQGVNGRREAAGYTVAENNTIELSTGTGTLSLYYQLGDEESTPIVYNYVVTNRTMTGVDGIYDAEEGARYFDLNGFEVKNPQAGQILIKVINGQAAKILVK